MPGTKSLCLASSESYEIGGITTEYHGMMTVSDYLQTYLVGTEDEYN